MRFMVILYIQYLGVSDLGDAYAMKYQNSQVCNESLVADNKTYHIIITLVIVQIIPYVFSCMYSMYISYVTVYLEFRLLI
jgi:hypothetical protein